MKKSLTVLVAAGLLVIFSFIFIPVPGFTFFPPKDSSAAEACASKYFIAVKATDDGRPYIVRDRLTFDIEGDRVYYQNAETYLKEKVGSKAVMRCIDYNARSADLVIYYDLEK